MRFDLDEGWKVWLLIGTVGFIVLLVMGTIFGAIVSLFAFTLKGLWLLVRFAFSSIAGFAVLVVAAYLIYRGYERLTEGDAREEKTAKYTDKDFER